MIRETGHSDRRLFFDAELLVAWLSDVLSPREQARLRAFLDRKATGRHATVIVPSSQPAPYRDRWGARG
ncbi:MAG: hypothetical protein JOZ69_04275 [Myxococcales bacterium]|nr:hypothetical protein [Myxococcales bacterium]